MNNYFPSNLRFLREKRGMEQLELAQLLGRKSASSISEWERGTYTPKAGVLSDIARIFNVSLSDLMNKDLTDEAVSENYYINEETQSIAQEIFENPDLRALFDASRNAKPEDLEIVKNLILDLKRKERS